MLYKGEKEKAGLEQKFQALKDYLSGLGSAAVAFSGGVDSTLLLKVACDVLGDKVIAVTASSPVSPGWELEQASLLAEEMGVRHIVIKSSELDMEEFIRNDKNRCYYCKKQRFKGILDIAEQNGILHVIDGSITMILGFQAGNGGCQRAWCFKSVNGSYDDQSRYSPAVKNVWPSYLG